MSTSESESRILFKRLEPGELSKLSSLAQLSTELNRLETDSLEAASHLLESLLETVGAERLTVIVDSREHGDNFYRRRTSDGYDDTRFRYSTTVVDQVARTGEPFLTLDAMEDESVSMSNSIQIEGARSVMCVPMRGIGQLYVDNLLSSGMFNKPELSLLTILGDLLASAFAQIRHTRRLAQANLELRASREETITRLAVAADWRDRETARHIERVGEYSASLARWYGCEQDFIESIRLASKMHDVGKLGVPDAILRKPGRYTDEEFSEMKRHTLMGGRILEDSLSPLLNMAHRIALTHHERYDGAGYPKGLKGEEIPLEGRIVNICDAFDAMVSKRVYKEAYSMDKAFGIIESELGRQFDPVLGRLFIEHRTDVEAIKSGLTVEAG